ncbi:cytochrome c3 family protein [Methylomicrobium lacus]|uniref:cytochrome c3 family protein n=1 Tax=Methylomicrobium lacus TaxID=136992 RepID=UPI0035A9A8FA
MKKPSPTRKRQHWAYAVGLAAGALSLSALVLPANDAWHRRGPMNTGHDQIQCPDCHQQAAGSYRQQIQANVRYLFGRREHPADFGKMAVANETCLDCHERPNDRHPVYRFLEPRFKKVRATLRPHLCVSCHQEHQGRRVVLGDSGYCVNCHKNTRLRNDPLDTPHARLIADKRWATCLGCHDFHGNHPIKTATRVAEAIRPEAIRAYFEGGPSPYGKDVRYPARKEKTHDE